MRKYKNANFKVTFTSENEFTVENKFGDTYKCHFSENGNICCRNRFGLKYAITARQQLGF